MKYAQKNWPAKLEEYEQVEPIFNGRNSFSKTDTDATFMRMEDDHMRNGQLKPGYNVQISTENQVILDYTVHSDTTDYNTLTTHLTSLEQTLGELPKAIVTDAGYGSEENYAFIEQKEAEAYIKHTFFYIFLLQKDIHTLHIGCFFILRIVLGLEKDVKRLKRIVKLLFFV